MNDLQSELAAFYADCEQRLSVCEAATAGPYTVTSFGGVWAAPDRVCRCDKFKNATFIAASRNQRPGEIRALVAAAKSLERIATIDTDCEGVPWPAANEAITALREILSDWRAGQ